MHPYLTCLDSLRERGPRRRGFCMSCHWQRHRRWQRHRVFFVRHCIQDVQLCTSHNNIYASPCCALTSFFMLHSLSFSLCVNLNTHILNFNPSPTVLSFLSLSLSLSIYLSLNLSLSLPLSLSKSLFNINQRYFFMARWYKAKLL